MFMSLSEYKDLLTTQDLCKVFGVSKVTIYNEIKKGTFGTPLVISNIKYFPKIFILKNFLNAIRSDNREG